MLGSHTASSGGAVPTAGEPHARSRAIAERRALDDDAWSTSQNDLASLGMGDPAREYEGRGW